MFCGSYSRSLKSTVKVKPANIVLLQSTIQVDFSKSGGIDGTLSDRRDWFQPSFLVGFWLPGTDPLYIYFQVCIPIVDFPVVSHFNVFNTDLRNWKITHHFLYSQQMVEYFYSFQKPMLLSAMVYITEMWCLKLFKINITEEYLHFPCFLLCVISEGNFLLWQGHETDFLLIFKVSWVSQFTSFI